MTSTKHTCTPHGGALPFGRKAPEGQCPRCDELHQGASARSLPWTPKQDVPYVRHICEGSGCSADNVRGAGLGVCTYGDW
jgi:hypothetical protein